jgi:hypothetical protein
MPMHILWSLFFLMLQHMAVSCPGGCSMSAGRTCKSPHQCVYTVSLTRWLPFFVS